MRRKLYTPFSCVALVVQTSGAFLAFEDPAAS